MIRDLDEVAEDTDVNRYVQSGLWLYCPGSTQCWYIFSDNLINYYEKMRILNAGNEDVAVILTVHKSSSLVIKPPKS
ncbi:hypothetical protein DICVIV_13778 [Dictyocaulus viviparus]|uniref:Uncharacterized protein n=1 Tax=Dictyocaulus viviparus TaxID=29172 RepID=A0A0D8XCY9_DICVI|nr:hypothetical protein DICVIV_13778 [Dictyocaulus viviparus]